MNYHPPHSAALIARLERENEELQRQISACTTSIIQLEQDKAVLSAKLDESRKTITTRMQTLFHRLQGV